MKRFLSPLFVFLCILIAFYCDIKHFLIYFCVVAIHELSHFVVAKKLGYRLIKFYIMPYGVCLNYNTDIFVGNDEIKIAMAGPLVNLFLCVFCVALWWCFPVTYYYLDYFCFCNLILGLFNALPCFPLDGGRVVTALLSKIYNRQKVEKCTYIVNYIISILLTSLFLISMTKDINFTYLFVAIFLFGGTINPEKYSSYKHISLHANRKNIYKNGVKVKILAVEENLPLFKIISKFSSNKFNVVYVIMKNGSVKLLSEININNLAIKYSPMMSISQIVGQK